MKVLFTHNGPLYKDTKNNDYYSTTFTDDALKRYYQIADELYIAIRVHEVSDPRQLERLSKITLTSFKVLEIPNLSSVKGQVFNRKKISESIYQYVLDADFIVVRLPSIIGDLVATTAKKLKKPYLVEMVGDPWDVSWNHSKRGKVLAPIRYYKTKKSVENASHVVYVTKKYLQKRYPTKGKQISLSNVSLDNLNQNILSKRLMKITKKKETDKIIIGTTGAIDVKYKGQQFVIKALGELKKQGITNFEYQLVGKGDSNFLKKIAIKHNVQSQVKFIGLLPHEEVFEWLNLIDIYIQPSLTEGLPRGLIEAMSRGLPALGAKSGGIPELLDKKMIFNNKTNVPVIVKHLLELDQKELLKQSKANFERAKEYQKYDLNNKRAKFFNDFKKYSETQQ